MLADLPHSALFAALDRVLAAQPGARACLARHAGKQLRLRLPLLTLNLRIAEGGGLAAADPAVEPATEILLPPELAFALLAGERNALDRARVTGDGVLASDLSAALRDFDWALALRPLVGDIAAARAAQAIAGFGRWREQAHDAIGQALAEYATFETDLLADKTAVRRFVTEVDALRDAAARIEARLALLEQARR